MAEAREKQHPRLRWHIVALLIVLALLTHYLLPRLGDVRRSLEVARRLDPLLLGGAIVAQICSYLCAGWSLQASVRLMREPLPLPRATMIEMAAATSCLVAGGLLGWVAAAYEWTRRAGVSEPAAMAAVPFSSFLSGAAQLLFAMISAAFLFAARALSMRAAVGLAVMSALLALAAAVAAAVLNRRSRAALLRAARRIPILRRHIDRESVDDTARNVGMMLSRMRSAAGPAAAVASILYFAFDALTLALVFAAAGVRVRWTALLAGYGLPLLLGRATLLPGGVAITELSMSGAYISLGVAPAAAVVSVVVYRLISFWIPTIAGIPMIVRLQAARRVATVAPRT